MGLPLIKNLANQHQISLKITFQIVTFQILLLSPSFFRMFSETCLTSQDILPAFWPGWEERADSASWDHGRGPKINHEFTKVEVSRKEGLKLLFV